MTKISCFLVCLLIYFWIKQSNCTLLTFVDHINGTMDQNFGNLSTKLVYINNDHHKYSASIDIRLKKFVKAMSVVFRFIQTPVSSKQEKAMNINRKIDVCKILKGYSLIDVFVAVALPLVRKFGRIPTACPVKPVK